jgi:hypothetical protein
MKMIRLRQIAFARSGDKGDISNVMIIPYRGSDYDLLLEKVTTQKVKKAYGDLVKGEIVRYSLGGTKAMNFVMHEALDGGVSESLCLDTHGKSRGVIMLNIKIQVSSDYSPPKTEDGEKIWSR